MKLVREHIFEKFSEDLSDPITDMGIGIPFYTLKPGAIIRSKRYFGVTEKTGQISGYHHSKIKIPMNSYLLITDVRNNKDIAKTKNISFKRYGTENLHFVQEERQKFKKGGVRALEWWGIPNGFFANISKIKFNYRFDIIEPGFNEIS